MTTDKALFERWKVYFDDVLNCCEPEELHFEIPMKTMRMTASSQNRHKKKLKCKYRCYKIINLLMKNPGRTVKKTRESVS